MFANSKAELLRAIGSGTTDIAANYGSSWYFLLFQISHKTWIAEVLRIKRDAELSPFFFKEPIEELC